MLDDRATAKARKWIASHPLGVKPRLEKWDAAASRLRPEQIRGMIGLLAEGTDYEHLAAAAAIRAAGGRVDTAGDDYESFHYVVHLPDGAVSEIRPVDLTPERYRQWMEDDDDAVDATELEELREELSKQKNVDVRPWPQQRRSEYRAALLYAVVAVGFGLGAFATGGILRWILLGAGALLALASVWIVLFMVTLEASLRVLDRFRDEKIH